VEYELSDGDSLSRWIDAVLLEHGCRCPCH
jgi:hypothetical protein